MNKFDVAFINHNTDYLYISLNYFLVNGRDVVNSKFSNCSSVVVYRCICKYKICVFVKMLFCRIINGLKTIITCILF